MASVSQKTNKNSSAGFVEEVSDEQASSTTQSSESFTTQELEKFGEQVQRYALGVLRIRRVNEDGKDETGTGCLIGGNLLITNYHVIANNDQAKKSKAEVWYIDYSEDQEMRHIYSLSLACAEVFYSRKDNIEDDIIGLADEDHLDYSIVILKDHPFLSKIQESCLSLFTNVEEIEDGKVGLIHYPVEVVKEGDIKGDRKFGSGLIHGKNKIAILHDATGQKGSSGGAVIDKQGRFIALHHQARRSQDDNSRNHRYAVLTSAIVADLEKKGKLEELKQRIAESKAALRTIEVTPKDLLISKLKETYRKLDTISVFTVKLKGSHNKDFPISSIYTHLAIIGEDERKEKKKELEPVEDGRPTTNETIYRAKEEIKPEEIFSHKKLQNASKKRAVIYGSAGIGKSTFVSYAINAWAEGKLWQEFEAVFCIRLRNLTKPNYKEGEHYEFYDLIQKEHRIPGLDFKTLLEDERFRSKTLLILDGYDELPLQAANCDEPLCKAFEELKENFPHVLVTSRPQGTDFDENCEFEILGFNNNQIKKYTASFFGKVDEESKQKCQKFLSCLEKTPLAKNLSYIPINLTILCSLFDENERIFDSETPLTMTQIYEKIIHQFYKVHLVKKGGHINDISNISRPDLAVNCLAACLEEIAFCATEAGRLYLDQESIEEVLYKRDVKLNLITELGPFIVEDSKGSFIHLTFQEFFAAMHISKLYINKDRNTAKEILRKHKFNPKFDLIWRMVGGYLSLRKKDVQLQEYFDDLFNEPKDHAIRSELILIARCFEECPNRANIRQYDGFVDVCVDYVEKMLDEDDVQELLNGNTSLLHHNELTSVIKTMIEETQFEKILNILKSIAQLKQQVPLEIIFSMGELLKDPKVDSDSKSKAASVLAEVAKSGQTFAKEALEGLAACLKDPSVESDAKSTVASAMGEVAKSGQTFAKEALEGLIACLKDPSFKSTAKSSVAYALGEVAKSGQTFAKEALEGLIACLKDPSVKSTAKSSVAYALGEVAKSGKTLPKEALEELIACLKYPSIDNDAKSPVAYALGEVAKSGQTFAKEALEGLIACLKDPSVKSTAKSTVASAIGEVAKSGKTLPKEALEGLAACLKDPSVKSTAKSTVAYALGEVAKSGQTFAKEALEGLIACLKDPSFDSDAKRYVADALKMVAKSGQTLPKEALEGLIACLKDPSVKSNAKRFVADALGEVAKSGQTLPKEALEELIACIKDPSVESYAKRFVASAIGEVAKSRQTLSKEALEGLIECLKEPSVESYAKRFVADALGEVAKSWQTLPKEALEGLIACLKDPSVESDAKSSVAYALGEVAKSGQTLPKEVLEGLAACLKDPSVDSDAKSSVADALGEVAKSGQTFAKEALEELIACLKDPSVDSDAKSSVAYALGEVAKSGQTLPKEAIEGLAACLKDPSFDSDAKNSVAYALGEVAKSGQTLPKEALEGLIACLKDPSVDSFAKRAVAQSIIEAFQNGKFCEIVPKKEELLLISFFGKAVLTGENGRFKIVGIKKGGSSLVFSVDEESTEPNKEPCKSLLKWREGLSLLQKNSGKSF